MSPPVMVGLYRGRGLVATLIKVQTRSKYSHAAIRFSDTVFEATPKGFGWTSAEKVTARVDWFVVEGATYEHWRAGLAWCNQRVGTKYDWWSLLRFLLPVRALFGDRETRQDRGRLICSEAVTLCLNAVGLPPLARVDPFKVSPALLSISPRLTEP